MSVVGLDSGLACKHSIASFMMSISWFSAWSMGGGMHWSNKSFDNNSSTDEVDMMEMTSISFVLVFRPLKTQLD